MRLTGQDIVIDLYPQPRLVTPDNTAPSHDMPAAHVTSVAGLAKAASSHAHESGVGVLIAAGLDDVLRVDLGAGDRVESRRREHT